MYLFILHFGASRLSNPQHNFRLLIIEYTTIMFVCFFYIELLRSYGILSPLGEKITQNYRQ